METGLCGEQDEPTAHSLTFSIFLSLFFSPSLSVSLPLSLPNRMSNFEEWVKQMVGELKKKLHIHQPVTFSALTPSTPPGNTLERQRRQRKEAAARLQGFFPFLNNRSTTILGSRVSNYLWAETLEASAKQKGPEMIKQQAQNGTWVDPLTSDPWQSSLKKVYGQN